MTRRMLIDAIHPEETRVVVASGNRLEETDYDTSHKAQLKGNIYLAKVTRVEPSLQAAFVDYGGNRHGFLAFSEIHPDYYRIPVEDREDLVDDENGEDADGEDENGSLEEVGGGDEDEIAEATRRRPKLRRHYKIQEVIKRRQILLVQVVKEERGNKGAALTTYLSLAGRYCVLMPNTSRGGGISRKITNSTDRKRLKSIISDLKTPPDMAVILRTAGSERSRAEIKRDFEYLMRLWDDIRAKTLESTAPALIHEEANLIKRSIRDLYAKDIDEVLVSGEEAYKTARTFMTNLIPSHAKKVKRYKEDIPLLQRYQMESQLAAIHDPVVQLKSGGYIVMHQTEALVAIDVNSGRSTRERNIEETALKTNSEAAEEVARQLRLRDLAGLIVIDFIDMEDQRNNNQVERKLKEAMRRDRARIQLGRISPFGLLEMSRQRLRPSLQEATSQVCVHCGGTGHILSTETQALRVLRAVEEEGLRRRALEVTVRVPAAVALYLLNNKRETMAEIEGRYEFQIVIETDDEHIGPSGFDVTRTKTREGKAGSEEAAEERAEETGDGERKRKRKRGRRRKRGDTGEETAVDQVAEASEEEAAEREETEADAAAEDGQEQPRKRRRRGRRGGRRARREAGDDVATAEAGEADSDAEAPEELEESEAPVDSEAADAETTEAEAPADEVEPAAAAKKPARRRTRRPKKADDPAEASDEAPAKPRRTRRRKSARTTAEEEGTGAEEVAEQETAAPVESEPETAPAASEPAADEPERPAEPIAAEPIADEVPETTPEPEIPAAHSEPAVPEPALLGGPEPAAAELAPPQQEESPPADDRPKRRGWWNRG